MQTDAFMFPDGKVPVGYLKEAVHYFNWRDKQLWYRLWERVGNDEPAYYWNGYPFFIDRIPDYWYEGRYYVRWNVYHGWERIYLTNYLERPEQRKTELFRKSAVSEDAKKRATINNWRM